MKKMFLQMLIFEVLLLVIFSCDKPTESVNTDLEIIGTWVAYNIDVTTGGPGTDTATGIITNSMATSVFGDDTVKIELVKYDNDQDIYVGKITKHPVPSFIDQYQKSAWEQSGNTMTSMAYEMKSVLAEAENSTTVVWGPAEFVKIGQIIK